jgi:hypothetical protein
MTIKQTSPANTYTRDEIEMILKAWGIEEPAPSSKNDLTVCFPGEKHWHRVSKIKVGRRWFYSITREEFAAA